MEQKQVKDLSGEELAEVLSVQFSQLMQAQQNIQIIQQELQRRKKPVEKVEAPKEETK